MAEALTATDSATDAPATTQPLFQRALAVGVAPWLFVLAGTLLRLCWPGDMEWKFDEKWMFRRALRVASGADAIPWVGMPSGVGLENPGFSIWPFALLGRITHDPVTMTHLVQWLNVFALWGFAVWVLYCWAERERALGLWAVALFAVSPLPVLFARKIWAQDLLPVLLVPWLWAHSQRARPAAAFAWGVIGMLLGQLHMSGFFVAAALGLVTLLQDRKRFPWLPFVLGSLCGAALMLPWVWYVLTPVARPAQAGGRLSIEFFTQALLNAWGLGLRYPLGGSGYRTFLSGPVIGGVTSHLLAAARYALFVLLAYGVVMLLRERKQLSASSQLRGYFWVVGVGGLLLTAARVHVHAHYLIAWSPLLHVCAAFVLYRHKRALLALCGLQLALSTGFWLHIHTQGGAKGADYGVAYSHQSEAERAPLP